ncbi:uncharacterized protein LOC134745180 [Cydia strobilella]|uniref:uncharacterized protein LOC134745180 n=1 Tax=Cydia strobilella TaxID=1100964 RepID=UPI003003FF32
MTGKGTDRKGKSKDIKSIAETVESTANFTLPDSLPADEVDYPVLITRKVTANWKEILDESQQFKDEIEEYMQRQQEPVLKSPFKKTETDYIKNEVFVCLIPAIEQTLVKAKIWQALQREKCFFNGIDWIVQYLWNNNPRYPQRANSPQHLFNMGWVRKLLKEWPRPYFPKSWLWPEDYAATMIQKTVRQYFVQREENVQEMREFWRKLKLELTQYPEMDVNPLLARKFASTKSIPKK